MERLSGREEIKDKLKSAGIVAAVIDFDNTLVSSYSLYRGKMRDYANVIASASGASDDEVYEFMSETLRGLRSEYFVSPAIMSEPARITALRYEQNPLSAPMVEARESLMEIYSPDSGYEAYEDVPATLRHLIGVGLDTYLATHAGKVFTLGRVREVGLNGLFKGIYPLDNMQEKNMWAWNYVYGDIGINPSESIVVGDSWDSDIRPALELGVPESQILRVRTRYDEANLNRIDGIREIDRFSEVTNVLPEMLRT